MGTLISSNPAHPFRTSDRPWEPGPFPLLPTPRVLGLPFSSRSRDSQPVTTSAADVPLELSPVPPQSHSLAQDLLPPSTWGPCLSSRLLACLCGKEQHAPSTHGACCHPGAFHTKRVSRPQASVGVSKHSARNLRKSSQANRCSPNAHSK